MRKATVLLNSYVIVWMLQLVFSFFRSNTTGSKAQSSGTGELAILSGAEELFPPEPVWSFVAQNERAYVEMHVVVQLGVSQYKSTGTVQFWHPVWHFLT